MASLPATSQDRSAVNREDIAIDYPYKSYQYGNVHQDDLKTYLNILRKRKWYIISSIFIIIPFMALNLYMEKQVYQSTTRILIENNTPKVLDIQEVMNLDRSGEFYLTEYEIIKSREHIEEVVDILQLDKKLPLEESIIEKNINTIKNFPRKIINALKSTIIRQETPVNASSGVTPLDHDELHRQEVIAQFYQSLQITPREGGKLVDVTVSGLNPHEVAQQANTLAEVYIRNNLEKKLEASRNAVVWLTEQTADLKEKVWAAELALQNFRETRSFISFDSEEKQNLVLSKLDHIYSAYTETNTERVNVENILNNIKKTPEKYINNIDMVSNNLDENLVSLIYRLKEKYLDLNVQYTRLIQKYKEQHPIMIDLQSQINEVKLSLDKELQKIMDSLQSRYDILRAKESLLEEELDKQKHEALRTSNDRITYNALMNDVKSYRDLYDDASKRLREIKLTQASVTNNVTVVERAAVPMAPVSSKKVTKMLLSVIVGCCLGVGLAFVREYFDDRFKEADEVEPYLQIPFLGIIPHSTLAKRKTHEPVSLREPASAIAEAYRTLRTRLQSSAPLLKTLCITSAAPSEGKSTTVANLGVSCAHLGLKVLLVDTDLRRPALHRHFQMSKEVGLTDVLVHDADWQQVIQETSLERLQILPAGAIHHNQSDVLSRPAMRTLIEQLRHAFDLVIFDSPIVLSLPDVEILAPEMDGVLLVHSPGRCDKRSVLEVKRILERVGAGLLGIIFNNVNKREQWYYYQPYYYSYHSDPRAHYRDMQTSHSSASHTMEKPSQLIEHKETDNDSYMSINITQLICKHEIDSHTAEEGFVFLAIDLEISNHSRNEQNFYPECTEILLDKTSKYNVALSKVFTFENARQLAWQNTNIYKFDPITEKLPNGLTRQLTMQPYDKKRGVIVYKIPENIHSCEFVYEYGWTNIAIPIKI